MLPRNIYTRSHNTAAKYDNLTSHKLHKRPLNTIHIETMKTFLGSLPMNDVLGVKLLPIVVSRNQRDPGAINFWTIAT